MADPHQGVWPDNVQRQVDSIDHQLDSIQHQIHSIQLSTPQLLQLHRKLGFLLHNVDHKLGVTGQPAIADDGNDNTDGDTYNHNRNTFCSTATTLHPSEQNTRRGSFTSSSFDAIDLSYNNPDEVPGYLDPTSTCLNALGSDGFHVSKTVLTGTTELQLFHALQSNPLSTVQFDDPSKALQRNVPDALLSPTNWGLFNTPGLSGIDTPRSDSFTAAQQDPFKPFESTSLVPFKSRSLHHPDATSINQADADSLSVHAATTSNADSIHQTAEHQTAELYSWAKSPHNTRVWPTLDKPFFCTFCAELGKLLPIKTKSDWKRHEEDYHYGTGLKWTCRCCSKDFHRGRDFKQHSKAEHEDKAGKTVVQLPRIYASGFEHCLQIDSNWRDRCNYVAKVMLQKDCPEWTYDRTIRSLLKQRNLKGPWKNVLGVLGPRHGITSSQLHWKLESTNGLRNQLEYFTFVVDLNALMQQVFNAGLPKQARTNQALSYNSPSTFPRSPSPKSGQTALSYPPVSTPTSPNFPQSPSGATGGSLTAPVPFAPFGERGCIGSSHLQTTPPHYDAAPPGKRASTMSVTMMDADFDFHTGHLLDYESNEADSFNDQPSFSMGHDSAHASGYSVNTTPQLPPPSTMHGSNPPVTEATRPTSRPGLFKRKSREFFGSKRSVPSIPPSDTMPPPSLPKSPGKHQLGHTAGRFYLNQS